jgi:plastocyanin
MTPRCRPRGSSSLAWVALAWLLGADPALAATHEVLIRNFAFEPPELTIQAGDSVRWTVVSGTHSATARDRSFDSAALAAGASFERRFEQPGVFRYFCTPHDFMRASVTVLPGRTYGPFTLAAVAAGVLALGAAALLVLRRRAR